MTYTRTDLTNMRESQFSYTFFGIVALIVSAIGTSEALGPGMGRWLVTSGTFFVLALLSFRRARSRGHEAARIEACLPD